MADAIITTEFKTRVLKNLLSDIDSDNYYFIGLGRSQPWDAQDDVPSLTDTQRTDRQFRYRLQSVKNVDNYTFTIERRTWTNGLIYSAYDDSETGNAANSYYILTDANNVYICIQQGRDSNGNAVASTVQPSNTSTNTLSVEADGYVWKYLYTIGAVKAANYLSANFMPIALIDSGLEITDPDYPQYQVQQAAIPKQIVGFRITNQGSGYITPSSVTVSINGDGSGAAGTPVIANQRVTNIVLDDSDINKAMGQDYNYATVTIAGGGGTGATAEPIFGPKLGLGADPRIDLRSDGMMFNVAITGQENDDFVVGNEYRQVGLFRNLTQYDSTALYTEGTGLALTKMSFQTLSLTGTFQEDELVTGSNSGAKAYIDMIDSDEIYFHQTEDTGFLAFNSSDVISTASASANVNDALIEPDIDKFSGELLFIDNRATAVPRAGGEGVTSADDIKVVIQL
jgi:hypothetical protein